MQTILADFDAAMNLSVAVTQHAHLLDANGNYAVNQDERELITQAAFVRMFVAFEEFLEQGFGHYGMGGASLVGTLANCYALAPSVDHLHKMYIGLLRFMDWSTPDKVRTLAGLYFAPNDPFTGPLSSAHTSLLDMKTVRNSASHVSRTTSAQADALYLRWTSQPAAGVSAYQILMANGGHAGATFMTEADQVLRAAAAQIANF